MNEETDKKIESKEDRAERRKDEAWQNLGETLREMSKGDDLGPLGQPRWEE